MKKIILTEADKKKIISEKEKAILEVFAKTFNKIKRIDENEINEGPNILFPVWLISKLNDVHTKVGQGSIFAMDVNKVVEIAKQVVAKQQNIDEIANSTGTISTNVNGVGYDLVLSMEKAKTLPNAQITTTNKVEGPTTLEVPAVKTSAPLQSFKTNQLTIIVRPMKNDAGEVIPNGYIILSVFPGNPNIPRISEWNDQYAVIIPDQQEQSKQPQQVSEVIDENQLLEEGWKEWLAAGLITVSTIAGVYKFNQNKIQTEKAGTELVYKAKSVLDNMSNDEKIELTQSLVDKGRISQLNSGLHLIGAPMSKSEYGDEYTKNQATHDRADSGFMDDNLNGWMQSNPGWFGITAQGKIIAI